MCTPDDVRGVTGSTLGDTVIQPFIDAATCILERINECMAALSTTCQNQVCTYLSAHLLTMSNVGEDSRTVKRESLDGKYTVEYMVGNFQASGVLATGYGQTANAMTGGCLAQLDKQPVGIFSIGSL